MSFTFNNILVEWQSSYCVFTPQSLEPLPVSEALASARASKMQPLMASEAQATLSLNEQVPRLSVMRGAAAVVAFHGNPKSP